MEADYKIIFERELKLHFYFISYPDEGYSRIWTDGNGKEHDMSTMSLQHIEGSIKMIDKNIKTLRDRPKEIKDILIPLAREKQEELKEVFREKMDNWAKRGKRI